MPLKIVCDVIITRIGEFQRQDAALVVVDLIFFRFVGVEHLHFGVFHADGDVVIGGTAAQGEYLGGEVGLLQLGVLGDVPRAHCVVETARPKILATMRDVDAAGPVLMARQTAETPPSSSSSSQTHTNHMGGGGLGLDGRNGKQS